MEEVVNNLYVGGDTDFEKIAHRTGWSALRVCKYGPGGHQQTLGYKTLAAPKGPHYLWAGKGNLLALNAVDLDDPHFVSEEMVNKGLDFIATRLSEGDKVLVACNQGQSRGPTLALLYMRRIGELPYNFIQAERIFRTIYPPYAPAQGMRQYARTHWGDERQTDG